MSLWYVMSKVLTNPIRHFSTRKPTLKEQHEDCTSGARGINTIREREGDDDDAES